MATFDALISKLNGVTESLGRMSSGARAASGELEKAHTRAGLLSAAVDGAASAIASTSSRVTKALDDAEQDVAKKNEQIGKTLDDMRGTVEQRLNALRALFEDEANNGNAWAQALLDLLDQVQNGTARAEDVIFAFGDGVTTVNGKLQSMKDLLSDVLPSTGEVQKAIQELRRQVEQSGDSLQTIMDLLLEQNNRYADLLARQIGLLKDGRITAEQLLRLAQKIADAAPPDSALGQLADALLNKLRGDGAR
jgi:methyl-accepting chemotaxis protein